MYKNIILPASLMVGTIIGAGIFALPYVFTKAGIVSGLFYLLAGALIFTLIHLMYADVISRTGDGHRFAGYAKIYLGDKAEWLTILTSIIGMFLILTIFLILSASFINLFLPNLPDIYKILIFWLIGSIIVLGGIKRIAVSEFLMVLGIIFIIFAVFSFGFGSLDKIKNFSLFDSSYFFLPYGPALFAFAGRVGVPAVIMYFKKGNEPVLKSKKPIILGTLFPAIVYAAFILGILAISGNVSKDSVSGLVGRLPEPILWLLGILGLLSLLSTYVPISLDIRKTLELDFKFPKILSGFAIILLPLILYFLGLRNFLGLISLIGGVFIGLESIILILIWRKAAKNPSPDAIIKKMNMAIPYTLLLIFILGIILEISR
ncbi:hypothetical protein HY227_01865 [Candidatus Wolfebacteria bacterium]|nr:hypothetical protein [Candidatus Wolfebacteria bacterium]